MRKPRALGVALVAMLVISAWAAAAAHAQTKFVAGNGTGTAKFKVEQELEAISVLKIPSVGNLECEAFQGEGTGNATATAVTLASSVYGECEFFGTNISPPNFHTCHYTIQANGGFSLGPAGCELTFEAKNKCAVTVKGQQDLSGVNYTNIQESGKKKELAANATLSGIAVSYQGSSCPSGSKTNATLSGAFKVRATDNTNNPIDLAVASRFRAGNGTGTATYALEQESSEPLQTLTMTPTNLECEEVGAEGTGNATTEEVELSGVAYGNCPNSYGLLDTVEFGTCHYVISDEGSLGLEPAGCHVNIDTHYWCNVSLEGGQHFGSNSVTYTNVHESGKPKEVIAHMEFSGIDYAWEGLHCYGATSGTGSNGAYKGIVRLKAYTPGGVQEDLAVE